MVGARSREVEESKRGMVNLVVDVFRDSIPSCHWVFYMSDPGRFRLRLSVGVKFPAFMFPIDLFRNIR